MRHLLVTSLFASLWYESVDCSSCVCEDKTLCQPLTSPLPEREVSLFKAFMNVQFDDHDCKLFSQEINCSC